MVNSGENHAKISRKATSQAAFEPEKAFHTSSESSQGLNSEEWPSSEKLSTPSRRSKDR